MGKYNVNVKHALKKVVITTEGFFSDEEEAEYIKEFRSLANRINAHEYSLEVDASTQSIIGQDVKDFFTEAFTLYDKSDFQPIIVKTGSNAILKMQCSNIIDENKFGITIL